MASEATAFRRDKARLMRSGFTPPSGEPVSRIGKIRTDEKLEGYLCAFQAFACDHGQPNAEVAESAQQFGCSGKGGGSQVCVQLAVIVDK